MISLVGELEAGLVLRVQFYQCFGLVMAERGERDYGIILRSSTRRRVRNSYSTSTEEVQQRKSCLGHRRPAKERDVHLVGIPPNAWVRFCPRIEKHVDAQHVGRPEHTCGESCMWVACEATAPSSAKTSTSMLRPFINAMTAVASQKYLRGTPFTDLGNAPSATLHHEMKGLLKTTPQ